MGKPLKLVLEGWLKKSNDTSSIKSASHQEFWGRKLHLTSEGTSSFDGNCRESSSVVGRLNGENDPVQSIPCKQSKGLWHHDAWFGRFLDFFSFHNKKGKLHVMNISQTVPLLSLAALCPSSTDPTIQEQKERLSQLPGHGPLGLLLTLGAL